ncbi:MAG: putative glycoside hydrolase [Candidatus Uhrbacteria bacterium]
MAKWLIPIKPIVLLVLFFYFLFLLFSSNNVVQSVTAIDKYVRTANYYLLSGTSLETKEALETLPKYDLLVLPAEAQLYNQEFFDQARAINPDIIILAYVPSVSWNSIWTDALHQQLYQGIKDEYWLRDNAGNRVSIWPGTTALNLNSGWSTYLAEYVDQQILSTGLWDGVFYDEVSDSISWLGNLETTDIQWRTGYTNLFSQTRMLVGNDPIIITNGSTQSAYQSYLNGRMFESFPTPWEDDGSWQTVVNNYLALEDQVGSAPPVFIINTNTDNTGQQDDYQKMRYGLTSTLLGGGYFSFDFGEQSHAQLWYYDEYDAYLGHPVDDPEDELDSSNTTFKPSVWARDFINGKILVNSTNSSQTIRLDGEYEKLHGTQDSKTNNGAIVSSITLPPNDGIILLRPIEEILDATFLNGSFARIFNNLGQTERTGFFAYDSRYQGGQEVINTDIDHDGTQESIVANDSQVTIYESDGSVHASFYPYDQNYTQGINLAVIDLEGDGTIEIITGTENGGGPHVRVFNKDGVLINPGFFAYAENFRGGVDIAVGDLDGDGLQEIITGAGYGGGPHVRVFSKHGNLVNPGFFAYDQDFRGGVNVAVGDVNADGIDDIITGPGAGGQSEIRVYDRDGNMTIQFSAFDTSGNTGVEVATTDFDGDGQAEIIGLSSQVFTFSFNR